MKYKVFQIGRLMVSSCFLSLFMNCNVHNGFYCMKSDTESSEEKKFDKEIIDKIKQLDISVEKENIDPKEISVSGVFANLIEVKSALDYIRNLEKGNKEKIKNLSSEKKLLKDPNEIIEIEQAIMKLKIDYASFEKEMALLSLEKGKLKFQEKEFKEKEKVRKSEHKKVEDSLKLQEKIGKQKYKTQQENDKLKNLEKKMEELTLEKGGNEKLEILKEEK